jgi:tripartite-type tricarboxylate transporter receptor subunit TctC
MYPKLDYDIEKDFDPPGLVANVPQVLVVNPKRVPVANFKTVPGDLRKNPGKLNYGSAGAAPRTTWRASCSSSRPRPSSPTSPTAAQARRCKT